jgi:hypothetical protein
VEDCRYCDYEAPFCHTASAVSRLSGQRGKPVLRSHPTFTPTRWHALSWDAGLGPSTLCPELFSSPLRISPLRRPISIPGLHRVGHAGELLGDRPQSLLEIPVMRLHRRLNTFRVAALST